MTVIILARATNGFVVAGDSRTCSGNLPYTIETDEAVKVRVHSFGSGGYVTASSGRARICNKTIDEVEQDVLAELAESASVPTPTEFAEYLRAAVRQFNLAQHCECTARENECVHLMQCDPCFNSSEPTPECPDCTLQWTSHGTSEYDCRCSPGEGLPADTPQRYPWCRCTTDREGALEWLCVPFGPDRGDPVIATISVDHEAPIAFETITRFPRVQGELRRPFTDKFTVVSETVQQADFAETDGVDANTKVLTDTVTRVRELLITAYREGQSSAALRNGVALPSEEDRAFTIREVADKVREGKKLDGENLEAQVGVPGIGGPATFVTALDDGTTSEWAEDIPRLDISPWPAPSLAIHRSPVRR